MDSPFLVIISYFHHWYEQENGFINRHGNTNTFLENMLKCYHTKVKRAKKRSKSWKSPGIFTARYNASVCPYKTLKHIETLQANIYLFKETDIYSGKRSYTCSKLTIKALERRHWTFFTSFSSNPICDFEQVTVRIKAYKL